MGILTVASGQSVYRGYEYAQAKKVLYVEQGDAGILRAAVSGSAENVYDVTVDIAHPKKSQCNCPHAAGNRVVCKHMVAVYFTEFPLEAEKYIAELEAYWEDEEQRDQEMEERLVRYVHRMKKHELQQALLQLLFDGPEWQYDRFIEENIGN